jgi:hypothetical protein
MGFIKEDIYVEGGDNKLLHLWTPGVEKFDTSSFYNWEQDNIPLYDLEERTYFLWEKAGWPTSGEPQVSGVVLSVSADALGTDEYANNTNLFLDLSSAIDALPDIIRYPIRIEVANFGDQGELVLNNVHFTGKGALEIVNRNFAPILPGLYDATMGETSSVITAGATTGGVPHVNQVSSLDLSNAIRDASALDISTTVVSSTTYEERYNDNNIVFAQMLHQSKDGTFTPNKVTKTARMTLGLHKSTGFMAAENKFTLDPYSIVNDLTCSNDFSGTSNQITGTAFGRHDINAFTGATAQLKTVGAFYGGWLGKMEVNNCGGPIYIRNFAVDGALGEQTPTKHYTKVGVNINNSDVVLEHCAAFRCYESGFEFSNSKVIASRGLISYRNYGLSANTQETRGRESNPNSAGIKLDNSYLTLSSVGAYGASGAGAIFASTRNSKGLLMHNSVIQGGDKRIIVNNAETMTSLQVYENETGGIEADNSKIDLAGAMDVWHHDTGIVAKNTEIKIDELYVDCHTTLGAHLINSRIVYGKTASPDIVDKTVAAALNNAEPQLPLGTVTPNGAQLQEWDESPGMVHFDSNGQHLKLENSKMEHPRLNMTLAASNGLSRTKYKRNHGKSLSTSSYPLSVPAIVLDNNSTGDFTFARIETQTGISFGAGGGKTTATGDHKDESGEFGRGGTSNAHYGSCLLIKNNSTCRLTGSDGEYTLLDGPEEYTKQMNNAGVYVDKNSTLDIGGPTVISRFGVDILVDNESTLNIGPPRDEFGFIDLDTWNLSGVNNNQTRVNLQSSRACLVANNNSTINMKDCGDFNGQWASSISDQMVWDSTEDKDQWFASSLVLSANYDTFETSAAHTHGYIQFLPNPQLQTNDSTMAASYSPSAGTALARARDDTAFPFSDMAAIDSQEVYSYSRGGMCVRALKGSRLNVRNVNFPCGWNNTSALYYNYTELDNDPLGCQQLRIWNIDETSQLDMTFPSVSGHFPPLVGYNGPSAVYVDPDGGIDGAKNAPDNTPYTSSLSVLDGFGPSGEALDPNGAAVPGTHRSAQNFGPFRLYVSPKRYAKHLVYTYEDGADTGIIYQTVAQGYNMSGPCSSVSVPSYPMTTSSGPDLYSVYGAGTTSPSGVQADLAMSSMNASAIFTQQWFGEARDRRNYTSAIGISVSSGPGCANTRGDDQDFWASGVKDTFPEGPDQCDLYAVAQPYFKHYKESNFFRTEDLVADGYESRIRLDEAAMAVFANAKNATLGISGRPRLVTMKTSTTSYAGEGAESEADLAGRGFLSASEFDLNKLD